MMKRLLALLLLLMLVFPALAEEKDNRYDGLGLYGENGMMPVQRNGLWGIVDVNGRQVVPCEWDDYIGKPFLHGDIMALTRDGRLAFVNKRGDMITGQLWDDAITYTIDGEHLFLLSDGVLSIWHANGEQLF